MGERIPLIGRRLTGRRQKRGLVIRTRDCDDIFPPPHVNRKHSEIQQEIDRRKVRDGETHGWIEHDGERVTGWHVDERLMGDA